MKLPTMEQLLKVGAHFGHKKEKSHPRMREFTYGIRNGIYVIDLAKTVQALEQAADFLKTELDGGKTILFVGTKRQARDAVKDVATALGQPYVISRWLGGTLTNFETILSSIKKLDALESEINALEGKVQQISKKSYKKLTDRYQRLLARYEGIRKVERLPDVIFAVDSMTEKVAVGEAERIEIPIVAIIDTNGNPQKITYPIPANDDSESTIRLILETIRDAVKKPESKGKKEVETSLKKRKATKELSKELANSKKVAVTA